MFPRLAIRLVPFLLIPLMALQAGPARAAAIREVTISDDAFTPSNITIATGDAVTWTNRDPVAHTVTGDSGTISSGTLAQGASYTHAFPTVGTYRYHCSIHPAMTGTVTVVDHLPTPTPAPHAASLPDSGPASPLPYAGGVLTLAAVLFLRRRKSLSRHIDVL